MAADTVTGAPTGAASRLLGGAAADLVTDRVTEESPAKAPRPSLPQTGRPAARPPIPELVPRRPSRFLLRFFDLYLSLYVPSRFHALRLAHPERFPLDERPLIVVINHPSWWDPLTSILISRFLLREADHYAPIDAASLPRNRILGGLGLFPVEQGTPRGAVQFLRAAQLILANPNALLWLTPQGGFTDARTRPVAFKSGLASLVKRFDRVTVVPLAYEYTFWNEPRPEILALCGQPVTFSRGLPESLPAARTAHTPGEHMEQSLAAAQDELAALALARDPSAFTSVLAGETGVSGLRALWLHLWAAIRARPYDRGRADTR